MKKKRIVQALLAVALIVILSIWGFENPFRKNTVEESKWWLEFEEDEISLGHGLTICKVGSYSGAFVEDGSDASVEDVMSIVLKNDSDKDLQYAVVKLGYGQEVASFAVTNLKAGAKAVVLEQNRMSAKDEGAQITSVENVVFYEEAQTVKDDQFRISGQKQTLNVKNISGEPILGDVYVYYKNVQDEAYLGGITYRVRISGGFAVDEIKQVSTSHYMPEKCEIVLVDIVQQM